MASASQSSRAYPKRKRAEVKYHESSDSDEDSQDELFDSAVEEEEEFPSKKKLKAQDAKAIIPTKPLPKHKIFPFKSLPAELKNNIYELTLKDQNGISLISKLKRYRRTVQRDLPTFDHSTSARAKHRNRWGSYVPSVSVQTQTGDSSTATPVPAKLAALVPNILLLDREIHAQTQPILYGGNDFILEDTTALHAFLATIGPMNCSTLTDLTVKGWGYTKAHKAMNHPAFTLLASAVNLQRLHMDCRIHYGGGPLPVARQFFRESFHFLEAVGAAKGKFDAALNVIEILPENFEAYRYSTGPAKPTEEEDLEEFRGELRKLMRFS